MDSRGRRAALPPGRAGRAPAPGGAVRTGVRSRVLASPVAEAIVPLRPRPFIFQHLRRNICPHFYLSGPRGAIPVQAPHMLKGLVRQPNSTSRCQVRPGVHLDESYVFDVCLSARFNQCVFYEDEISRVEEQR